jgi:hypothetical protein
MATATITLDGPDYRIDYRDGDYTGSEIGSAVNVDLAIARLYGAGYARLRRHGLVWVR